MPESGVGRFEEFYRREYRQVLASLVMVAGDMEVAQEATNEAFVRALERWDRVAAMEAPGGWLYRTALNVARRRMRRAAMERRVSFDRRGEDPTPPGLSFEVWQALRSLPCRQRTAVALRYLLDLSEREVAETMGVARGTVSATLVAARRSLAAHLGDVRDSPSPGHHEQLTTERGGRAATSGEPSRPPRY